MAATGPVLELRNVTKRFPGVVAAQDVSLVFSPGRVHALLGENGAGKSTIVKAIGGVHQPDEGTLLVDGNPVRFSSPSEAERHGVAVVHQHRTLVEELSIAENLFLGRLGRDWHPFRRRALEAKATELLREAGLDLDPATKVADLGPAGQQRVEIARALGRDARVIVFDEPTTSLTPPEREVLFQQVRSLRDRGLAVVYISHDLEDTLALCDEVTVLRDGRVVAHEDGNVSVGSVVHHMIGRTLDEGYPRTRRARPEVALRAENLSNAHLDGISLDVHQGEIVCIAGLVGSGRTELLRAVFGLDRVQSGVVAVGGRELVRRSPRSSIRAGVGMVTEDRKGQGLVLESSVGANVMLGNEKASSIGGLISAGRQRAIVQEAIRSLRIKTSSAAVAVGTLSGGNQQKVVLGRWLARETKVLLIDEPTVGIDVGARAEFYRLLDDYAAAGGACLVVSSDLTEVIGLADRVIVMRGGMAVALMEGTEMTRPNLLQAMTVQTS